MRFNPKFLVVVLMVGVTLWAQGTKQPLTDAEKMQVELAVQKERTNAAEAQAIRTAYELNQVNGEKLRQASEMVHDRICKAHGLAPATCHLTPDGSALFEKATAANPLLKVPNFKKGR